MHYSIIINIRGVDYMETREDLMRRLKDIGAQKEQKREKGLDKTRENLHEIMAQAEQKQKEGADKTRKNLQGIGER